MPDPNSIKLKEAYQQEIMSISTTYFLFHFLFKLKVIDLEGFRYSEVRAFCHRRLKDGT